MTRLVFQQNSLTGIVFMISGVAMLSTMDAVAKWLVMDYAIFQILAIRGLVSLTILTPILAKRNGLRHVMRTERLKGQIVRSFCGIVALFGFFSALRLMPLADATAIFFSATLFLAALSFPLLREPVGFKQWLAIVIGFAGVVIIIQPGGDLFNPASGLVLISAFSYALMMTMTRRLSPTESNVSLVFYHALIATLVGLVALPFVWKTPTIIELSLFLLIGVLATMAHLSMAQAFRSAPVAIVAPFEYSTLLWAAFFGYVFWSEIPKPNLWFGAAIIVATGIFIIGTESRIRRVSNLKT